MRILCDQNVATRYCQAFDRVNWLVVSTVAAELSPDATDEAIADFASRCGWVVFTTDDDFYAQNVPHGLVVYSQIEDPDPGDVLAAIEVITEVYDSHDEIEEFVPNGWL